ncbi:hypothetical protein PPERSA_08720 [Pseudocohnilembus persalinus]|uniref:Uncharacterized protein n=1 Tax=Pseudocohnilembus persalinus TaxID=266149 RepID=A0A0V0QXC3_PSEPJ|nr:hypothetical protein PPERSA_08720 [Pseudocohnilembus persalinus]|eukprot:KRX07043.1 hypothetical protein PPERSA_08720 [Pseudocohnilembus persalinus]
MKIIEIQEKFEQKQKEEKGYGESLESNNIQNKQVKDIKQIQLSSQKQEAMSQAQLIQELQEKQNILKKKQFDKSDMSLVYQIGKLDQILKDKIKQEIENSRVNYSLICHSSRMVNQNKNMENLFIRDKDRILTSQNSYREAGQKYESLKNNSQKFEEKNEPVENEREKMESLFQSFRFLGHSSQTGKRAFSSQQNQRKKQSYLQIQKHKNIKYQNIQQSQQKKQFFEEGQQIQNENDDTKIVLNKKNQIKRFLERNFIEKGDYNFKSKKEKQLAQNFLDQSSFEVDLNKSSFKSTDQIYNKYQTKIQKYILQFLKKKFGNQYLSQREKEEKINKHFENIYQRVCSQDFGFLENKSKTEKEKENEKFLAQKKFVQKLFFCEDFEVNQVLAEDYSQYLSGIRQNSSNFTENKDIQSLKQQFKTQSSEVIFGEDEQFYFQDENDNENENKNKNRIDLNEYQIQNKNQSLDQYYKEGSIKRQDFSQKNLFKNDKICKTEVNSEYMRQNSQESTNFFDAIQQNFWEKLDNQSDQGNKTTKNKNWNFQQYQTPRQNEFKTEKNSINSGFSPKIFNFERGVQKSQSLNFNQLQYQDYYQIKEGTNIQNFDEIIDENDDNNDLIKNNNKFSQEKDNSKVAKCQHFEKIVEFEMG